jgi:hypothetical protein
MSQDYPAYMRSQSKNALKAMAVALKPIPDAPPAAETDPRSEIDALCAELEARVPNPWFLVGTRIAKAVAKAHSVSFREMISPRRYRHLAHARQEAIYLMAKYTTLSLGQIGKILGNRDHTTILHGLRVHTNRLQMRDAA